MAFNKDKIQELYPGAMMYETMKIYASTDNSLQNACESNKYFGQLKKDGFWYQFEKQEQGNYLFSRSASTKTGLQSEKSANVPHIVQALSCLPDGTILIGEIYYPGGSSKDTTTIMGCLPKKAIERQNSSYGLIHYYIHDIIMFNNIDFVVAETGAWDRYCILKKVWEKYNLDQYDFLELAEVWTEDLYSRAGDALAAGEEGMVLKLKEGKYEPGKRPQTNLKVKKIDFADVVIIGFEEPTKEYYGKEIENWQYWVSPENENHINGVESKYPIGFYYSAFKVDDENEFKPVTKAYYMGWNNARIQIGAYDENMQLKKIGTIHSGISDEMKKDMTENPNKYLNKVCLIQCMELDNKECTIRHGFFKGIREDKEVFDCTIKDIFGQDLLKYNF